MNEYGQLISRRIDYGKCQKVQCRNLGLDPDSNETNYTKMMEYIEQEIN